MSVQFIRVVYRLQIKIHKRLLRSLLRPKVDIGRHEAPYTKITSPKFLTSAFTNNYAACLLYHLTANNNFRLVNNGQKSIIAARVPRWAQDWEDETYAGVWNHFCRKIYELLSCPPVYWELFRRFYKATRGTADKTTTTVHSWTAVSY